MNTDSTTDPIRTNSEIDIVKRDETEERSLHPAARGSDESIAGHGRGYAGGGMTDTNSPGSSGDPTDRANLEDATTGPSSAPGYRVINTK